MQTGIVVSDELITGTLKYVSGYTGFSSEVNEQSGNYLALKFDVKPSESLVEVEIVGGSKGPVMLDEDMMWVGLITDKANQSIKVTIESDTSTLSKTYSLAGLTLEKE